MAINKEFEAYKIKRELKRSGIEYQFKRKGMNDFVSQLMSLKKWVSSKVCIMRRIVIFKSQQMIQPKVNQENPYDSLLV